METVELLLHPVRIRIVHAMYDGRTRTTTELRSLLPDVSKATLYRHTSLLVEGGLLVVADEQPVRGSMERHYRLHRGRVVLDPEAAAALSLDDFRRAFAVATATLMAEFNTYLERGDAAPVADLVGFRQYSLWLSPDELAEMIAELREVIVARAANEPTPQRTRHLLSPIVFPAEGPPTRGDTSS
ncbi:helix-turn-helix domain-containing protein [Streptomyces sp. NPDC127108]|uniref:helix-turn-helix domain-containing protein n=1 Tax=Streptomyces sp. NPDC127108 TaxID=3345361 RepID=UPI00362E0E9D